MVTKQLLKRELFGSLVKQDSKTGYFSATDLARIGSMWRLSHGKEMFNLKYFFENKNTKEFVKFLEEEENCVAKINSKGKGQDTWVHPYLFIKIALAISPELEVRTYKWLYDELLKYRNNSGDSFKKMCGALYINRSNKATFAEDMKILCCRIRKECGVNENMNDKEAWNKATEKQLELRDKIHEYIAQFSDIIQGENLYDIAIKKAKEEVNA